MGTNLGFEKLRTPADLAARAANAFGDRLRRRRTVLREILSPAVRDFDGTMIGAINEAIARKRQNKGRT